MSQYHGDIRLGDTIDIQFTTRQISGAPSTLSSSPVISAYVGNSTTEITAGITLSVDFDSRTGFNNVRVVASGGNGFATATNVSLVITTGTVNSVSVVGECIGAFSIENRSAVMPTTAARTLDVSATGEAGIDWANVGSPTTAVNLSATTTNLVNTVTTYTGNTVQTGDSFARIGANGAGLSNITLPSGGLANVTAWTVAITGNITGNLSGSVGSLTTNNDKTGYGLTSAYDFAKGTVAMTESYAALHVAPTPAQIFFEMRSLLAEFSVSGTTGTGKKIDGSTTAETFTLDSATAPTSMTRAS